MKAGRYDGQNNSDNSPSVNNALSSSCILRFYNKYFYAAKNPQPILRLMVKMVSNELIINNRKLCGEYISLN